MSSPTITPSRELQELAAQMSRQFEDTIQQAAEGGSSRGYSRETSRDYYPGGTESRGTRAGGAASTTAAPAELEERFFPLLATLLPTVISAVPSIIDTIQQQNRDLITPTRDPAQMERDFLSVLSELTPKLVESIPTLISALEASSRDLPRDENQATARFFGALLSSVVPTLIEAAPGIAATFLGGRRELPTRVDDPEMTTRFLGPLLSGVIQHVAPQMSNIMSIFGR